MTTAIVTWITYNNFGTELQAFALQHFICEKFGECITISDKPIVDSKTGYSAASKKRIIYRKEHRTAHIKVLIKRYAFKPSAIADRIIQLRRNKKEKAIERIMLDSQKAFEMFKNNDIKVLPVNSIEDYEGLNSKFDAFVCGSDQIWSLLKCNFNEYYYLSFARKKKVSYATSIGAYKIEDDKKETIIELLNDFFAISVREKKTAEQLSEILGRKVDWVVDPTMLYEMHFWRNMEIVPEMPKKYLLCYFLEDKPWYFSYAQRISKLLKLRIVLLPNRKSFAFRHELLMKPVGPKEFIGLVDAASYVLTDSYHGAIFSILFNKQFQYLKRFEDDADDNQNIRVESLFDALEIKKQVLICCEEDEMTRINELDYKRINEAVNIMRQESIAFLEHTLGEV